MLEDAPLGKHTPYINTYSPHLLYPVSRELGRNKLGLKNSSLPFFGVDIWNGFELSWLDPQGKPIVALAVFEFPCATSHSIVESKSFKLYLNSFNQSQFESFDTVKDILQRDLSQAVGNSVEVNLYPLHQNPMQTFQDFSGICLDELVIATTCYEVNPQLLKVAADQTSITEALYSHLLKSNCLATGQPDWGSIWIQYTGSPINHEGLLKYIISYRNHSGFAEHCVEQIFQDILTVCSPEKLAVYIRYTRRGGLDINVFRSNFEISPFNNRLVRQ